MGNPIGPGSDSQIVRFDYFDNHVIWSFWVQRIFVDKDYFYTLTIRNNYNHDNNFSKFVFGLSRQGLTKFIDWEISLAYQLNMNYGWKPGEYRHNLTAALTIDY